MRIPLPTFIMAALAVVLMLASPNPVRAQMSAGKFIGSWQTIRQVMDDGSYSCQAIQCRGGACGQNKYFILLANPKNKYVIPTYNNYFATPPGTKAKLVIGKKSFGYINRAKKPSKALMPVDWPALVGVMRAMVALEKANPAGKFRVISPKGQSLDFSVRGVGRVLTEFNRVCKSAKRGY